MHDRTAKYACSILQAMWAIYISKVYNINGSDIRTMPSEHKASAYWMPRRTSTAKTHFNPRQCTRYQTGETIKVLLIGYAGGYKNNKGGMCVESQTLMNSVVRGWWKTMKIAVLCRKEKKKEKRNTRIENPSTPFCLLFLLTPSIPVSCVFRVCAVEKRRKKR